MSSAVPGDPVWLDELRVSPDGAFVIALVGGTINVMADSVKVFPVAQLRKK